MRLVVEQRPTRATVEFALLLLALTGVGLWIFTIWPPAGIPILGLAPVTAILLRRTFLGERAVFDRARTTLRLVRRGPGATTRIELPLARITGVEVVPNGRPQDQDFSGRLMLTRADAPPLAVNQLPRGLGELRPVAAVITTWLEATSEDG